MLSPGSKSAWHLSHRHFAISFILKAMISQSAGYSLLFAPFLSIIVARSVICLSHQLVPFLYCHLALRTVLSKYPVSYPVPYLNPVARYHDYIAVCTLVYNLMASIGLIPYCSVVGLVLAQLRGTPPGRLEQCSQAYDLAWLLRSTCHSPFQHCFHAGSLKALQHTFQK